MCNVQCVMCNVYCVSGDEVHASTASCPTQRSPGSASQPLGGDTRRGHPWRPLGQHALRPARPGAEAGDQTSAQRVRAGRGSPPCHAPSECLATSGDRSLPRHGDKLRHKLSLARARPPTPRIRHEW